ncbi:hypothetical protein GCM10027612_05730 [Microbispora bryophytorum subsp. camponoti]
MVDHRRQWPITDDLAALRENIQRYALRAGLTGSRLDDLVIAANEAAINVLEHGGEPALWRSPATAACSPSTSPTTSASCGPVRCRTNGPPVAATAASACGSWVSCATR